MDDFKNFLRINPYPHYLGIAFNKDMRNAILEEAGVEPDDIEDRDYGAITEFYRNGAQAAALCVVTFFQEGEIPHWTMAHEAVHVADDVMERCGWHHDYRNDEAYAYLIEWIVRMMVFAQDAKDNLDSHKGAYFTDVMRTRMRMAQNERSESLDITCPFPNVTPVKPTGVPATILTADERNVYSLIMPVGLHPEAQTLVAGVAQDMANKLMKAQEKYGWLNDWRNETYTHVQWIDDVIRHLQKGDPLDIINYMAFARDRKWDTTLVQDGFAAMFVKQDKDKLAVETLNLAQTLIDAKEHKQAIDPDNTAEQFESLATGKQEPCCPECKSPRITESANTAEYLYYCKNCGNEFDKYDLRER